MKLKTTIKADYTHGAIKSKFRFAWLPHRVGNVRVWLERYEVLYIYMVSEVQVKLGSDDLQFSIGKWQKVTERIV